INHPGQRFELELLLFKEFQGGFVRLAVDTHIGDSFQPVARRQMERRPRRQFQAAQKVLLDELDGILDASFFVRLTHPASADFKPAVAGKIQVARIEDRGLAQRMAQHGGLAVVDHDPRGHALEKPKRVFVAVQEQLLALPQSELDIEQAAVTEHPDKEGKPAAGRTYGNGAPTAPIDLETFPRSKLEGEESFERFRPNQPHILRDDRVTGLNPLGPQPLKDLLRAQVVRLQPAFDQRLVRVKLAAPAGTLRLVIIVLEPVADGFLIQLKLLRNLAGLELLFLAQGTDAAISGVIDHGWPPFSKTCARTSLRLRGWPERGVGADTGAGSSKA